MSHQQLAATTDMAMNNSCLLRPTPPPMSLPPPASFQSSSDIVNRHQVIEANEEAMGERQLASRYIPLAPPGLEYIRRQAIHACPLLDVQRGDVALGYNPILNHLMMKNDEIELSDNIDDNPDPEYDSDSGSSNASGDLFDELDESDGFASSITLGSVDTESDSQSDVSMSGASSQSGSTATSSDIDTIELLETLSPYPQRPLRESMYVPQQAEGNENSAGTIRRDRHLKRRLLTRPLYAQFRRIGEDHTPGEPSHIPGVKISNQFEIGQTFVTAGQDSNDKDNITVDPFIRHAACNYLDFEDGPFRPIAGVLNNDTEAGTI
ncbi:hypothetical protein FA13DRAFT_1711521 [Coprinellus micaceus]|uniref:Uncharacterized protein n=1 Tax=Coprinellus micaceus TaxID=71717 RepID=A0A4Y7T3S5_COPMI|nr:hypothetical protein FA13DRAFT_1711521 [Coprinellus micaceus]